MLRNDFSRDQARQRIDAQMSQEEKKQFADFLIDTSNGFEDTRQQTLRVFDQLKLL
jgi:dephospho-CoA kinase